MAAASLVMCALVDYFFLFGYSLTCTSFWNCQFGDLGYVCLGGLLSFFFFLFGYSLMCSRFFGIANCQILVMCASLWLFSHMLQLFGIANLEILVMCALVAYFFFFPLSLSLWLFSHAIQLFWNSQFGEPFQVHKIFQAFQILGI